MRRVHCLHQSLCNHSTELYATSPSYNVALLQMLDAECTEIFSCLIICGFVALLCGISSLKRRFKSMLFFYEITKVLCVFYMLCRSKQAVRHVKAFKLKTDINIYIK